MQEKNHYESLMTRIAKHIGRVFVPPEVEISSPLYRALRSQTGT
jgi:hypothetical protein